MLYFHTDDTVDSQPCGRPDVCDCEKKAKAAQRPPCTQHNSFRFDQDMGVCKCGFVTDARLYTGAVDTNGYATGDFL